MYDILQNLIDSAGYADVRLVDIKPNPSNPDSIDIVGGLQLKAYKQPSYGETLMFSVVEAENSELSSQYIKMYQGIIESILIADPKKKRFANRDAVVEFVQILLTDVKSLDDKDLDFLASTGVADDLAQVRNSAKVNASLGNMRALQNQMLIWFLNNRKVGDQTFDMSYLYSLYPDAVEELKGFMQLQLSPPSDPEVSGQGEVRGKK